ncbi:MAG TPA: hypothetical protein VEH81_00390, partial [Ktedonobacteraceae bacterium]|nr:hypothetical protein [Ktedonobacteraceae bacterium]
HVLLPQFDICEHGIHAHISDTTHLVRTRPERTTPKIFHIKRTCRPGVREAGTTDFLFDKQSKLANQYRFPMLGAPDKVIGQFIRDVFGVLCIHTQ